MRKETILHTLIQRIHNFEASNRKERCAWRALPKIHNTINECKSIQPHEPANFAFLMYNLCRSAGLQQCLVT